jgi:hypothetical protein
MSIQWQGAGLISILAAIRSSVSVSPAKLALGVTAGIVTRTVTITNTGTSSIAFSLGSVPGLAQVSGDCMRCIASGAVNSCSSRSQDNR